MNISCFALRLPITAQAYGETVLPVSPPLLIGRELPAVAHSLSFCTTPSFKRSMTVRDY